MKCKCECQTPDTISFWVMHDNHTFTEIEGKTLDNVISNIHKEYQKDPWISVCPAILERGDKEIRRVGDVVHFTWTGWNESMIQKWRSTLEDDEDVRRLMQCDSK